MKITLIAVGKLKEDYLKKGMVDYEKRLKRLCDFNIVELNDAPDKKDEAQISLQKEKEAQDILAHVPKGAYLWALDLRGKELSSEAFAAEIEKKGIMGESHICFVIGASNGIGENVLKKSKSVTSFSPLTFPHGLFRLIFTEQLYRAFKIINNETYHK